MKTSSSSNSGRVILGLFVALAFIAARPAAAQTGLTVGQKVEAWNVAWYKATVVEIGSGKNAGYIKVHYDDFASEQYLKESSIRVPKTAAVDNYVAGPRNGRYTIQSYGNIHNPLIIGYFDLKTGRYAYYDAGKNVIGTGTYSYDAGSNRVIWKSGPLQRYGADADFKISREGKTHSIGMKPRFGTAASNSTDSK